MSAGIPVKLLNEAQGHIISLELTTGDTYRGKLLENEDNMNLSLYDVTITKGRTGATSYMNQVFVRGSMIRFVSVPDILKNAPMFFMKPNDKPKAPVRGSTGVKRARH
ncbi:Sm-like ribonucleo protein [Hyphopichia burtonii NRRL Y-1933]|uniref:Small nuclear ribonucleoprotein Sm D3 n=1 Tax=Hyphopichia burtonii NRRL Y-1933 TaxID=984485 RepID=A0A1E4RPQ2_9ASCO|nr:Sm-like ribonucleo protein [Hyphopichia burtonii NRRL Y-1933]ODV69065.1 Sm-like ribonucleo protein [Hyphopichia burtonii NRRL Y-1933]